jgi:hypothetical protein
MVTNTITVLDPTAKARVVEGSAAPRVRDMEGKRLGFLCNDKPNAEALMSRIGELLSQKVSLAGIHWQHAHSGPTVDARLIEEMARTSDMVINGVGD